MNIQQKNKPTSLSDRDERLKKVASYNHLSLEAMTMNELRELGAFLIPGARKLNKPAFVDALIEVSESYRQERIRDTAIALEFMGDVDFGVDFVGGCYLKGLPASETGQLIWSKITSQGYSEATIAKTQPKKLRAVLDKIALKNEGAQAWADEVFRTVADLTKETNAKINAQYKEKVEHYGEGEALRKLGGTLIMSWAEETIDWAFEQDRLDKGWHRVSLALALTSGRRMDEIHGTTRYEVVDKKTMRAVGLSKKRDDGFTLESPCLVDAYKWLAVHNKLPEKRRGQPNAVVNHVISRAISESLKSTEYPKLGIDTYKDARDFYVAYLIKTQYDRTRHGNELNFAKKILGHESKRVTMSYQKLVVV